MGPVVTRSKSMPRAISTERRHASRSRSSAPTRWVTRGR